jgi:hypothetical protein
MNIVEGLRFRGDHYYILGEIAPHAWYIPSAVHVTEGSKSISRNQDSVIQIYGEEKYRKNENRNSSSTLYLTPA